ncbi:hypothetical protein K438DRAFT_1711983, partial [Mycena galopus ATCC 62051]
MRGYTTDLKLIRIKNLSAEPDGPHAHHDTHNVISISPDSSSPNGQPTRVITTSSGAHYLAMHDSKTFEDGPARRKLSLSQIYGQSKWANLTPANE